jgi:predicted RNase H-like HicB family nuclease
MPAPLEAGRRIALRYIRATPAGWRIAMPRYVIVVETDATSTGIWVPDMPGCTTMGKTVDEALANLNEALELWSEGQELPEARDVAEIRRLPDVVADLEAGAVLMLVPFLRESANISLDAGLLDDIDAAARLAGLSRSAYLASAAREKMRAG